MSLSYKIPLGTAVFVAFTALLSLVSSGSLVPFVWGYTIGAVPLGALLTVGAGISYFINREDREITYGILLTGLLLLLTGFFVWATVPFGR